MGQLIDIEACQEFMTEIQQRVELDILTELARQLEEKSAFFVSKLDQGTIDQLKEDDLKELLRKVFATRRKVGDMLTKYPVEAYRDGINRLLYGSDAPDLRFNQFLADFNQLDAGILHDLAGELLHYTMPEKYWLWNRWLWDPIKKTGVLPLLTHDETNMTAATYGKMYMNVGQVVAYVHAMAEPVGFQKIDRSLFGTDVYMASVYVVYAYTVLKIKMTSEFNNVMPGLTEFTCRILGLPVLKLAY